jgi:hypothetical protein
LQRVCWFFPAPYPAEARAPPGEAEIIGALAVSIAADYLMNRTIVPDIDMKPAAFIVSGTGPDSTSFQVETTGTDIVVTELAFGDWLVVVEDLNKDGQRIGSGMGSATIHTGQTASCTVKVVPYEGSGTLDLEVLWKAADVETPSIEAVLIPYAASVQDLNFSIDQTNDSAVFHDDAVATGYYTLVVKLLDNGLLTMGAVEVVRIIKDQVSHGTFEFYEINKPGGNIDVNITPEMADPLDVVINGNLPVIPRGGSMTLTAGVTNNDADAVVYVWYINGNSVDTGRSITVGDSLEDGYYNLIVTAFTTDGTRAGSTSCTFKVDKEFFDVNFKKSRVLS